MQENLRTSKQLRDLGAFFLQETSSHTRKQLERQELKLVGVDAAKTEVRQVKGLRFIAWHDPFTALGSPVRRTKPGFLN